MSLRREMEGDSIVLYDRNQKVLSIEEKQDGNTVHIILEGKLNSETAHDFQDEMVALALCGVDLRIDMTKVSYLSSACTQTLLLIQQKMDDKGAGSLTLVSLPATIYEQLDSIGMTELLMIE